MMPLPHTYTTQLVGRQEGYATISEAPLPDLTVASPADFDGPGDAWSPEHLLLASVQACYLFTLRAVARAMSLRFETLGLAATGIVDREDGALRFTEIRLRVGLTLAAGADLDRTRVALEKAKRGCLISASLSTPVQVEITITEAPAARPDTAAA